MDKRLSLLNLMTFHALEELEEPSAFASSKDLWKQAVKEAYQSSSFAEKFETHGPLGFRLYH